MNQEILTEWIKAASVFLFVVVLVVAFLLLVRWLLNNASQRRIATQESAQRAPRKKHRSSHRKTEAPREQPTH